MKHSTAWINQFLKMVVRKKRGVWAILILLMVGLFFYTQPTLFGLSLSNPANPLNPAAEYKRIYERQQNLQTEAGQQHWIGYIKLYEGYDSTHIKELSHFESIQTDTAQYYQLEYMIYLSIGQHRVVIDTLHQWYASSLIDTALSARIDGSLLGFTQLLTHDDTTLAHRSWITQNKKDNILEIQTEALPKMKQLGLHYNPLTYDVTYCTIKWWKEHVNTNPPQALDYTTDIYFHPAPSLDKLALLQKIAHYARLENNEWTLNKSYSSYQKK